MTDFNRRYVGRAGRPELRGKPCRVLHGWRGQGAIRNVHLEFQSGERLACPVRCIRKSEAAHA